MSFLWFLVALTFFALWLSARSKNRRTDTDAGYGQGYWDGYRAFGSKVAEMLQSDTLTKRRLQKLVDEGNGSAANQPEPEARHEELGIIPEGTDEDVWDDEESREIPAQPTPVATSISPQPILSEEELAEQRQRETLQNLNILLYVASFLIVAAAALFVTLIMPAEVKLFSLIFVTLAFYVGGMVLHVNSERLRPAAVAFVGTGLAILPFIGFALILLGGLSGETAWFVTSVLGLLMYAYAAVRLQSQLVSYLTMAFVLSLALSAVSTLSLSLVWYFIVTIGVSLLCNSLHILWPKLMPSVFAKPIEQTGQLTTPLALVASLFVTSDMQLYMYEVLYGVATAHYLVVWLEKRQLLYEMIVRVLAHITLLIVAVDVTQLASERIQFGIWLIALAAVQSLYSLVRVQPRSEDVQMLQVERIFLCVSLGMMGLGVAWWSGMLHVWVYTVAGLSVIGVTALAATLRLREAGWAYVGLLSSVLLPFVLLRQVFEPAVSYEVIAGGFTILGIFALMGLEQARARNKSAAVQTMLVVATVVYAVTVSLCGILAYDGHTIGWTTLLTAALFVALSYVTRLLLFEVVGGLFVIASVASWIAVSSLDEHWRVLSTVAVAAVLILAGASAHHFNHERSRRDGMACLGAVVLACLVFTTFDTSDSVVPRVATVLLLAAAVVGVAVRFLTHTTRSVLQQLSQLVYLGYPFLALIVSWQAGMGWVTLVFTVYAALLWVGSYVERQPLLLAIGNVVLVGMLNALWYWLEFDTSWHLYGVAWIATSVFYVVYWLMYDKKDVVRQQISLVSVYLVLIFAVAGGLLSSQMEFVLAAVGSLLAGAAVLAVQGYLDGKRDYIEAAVYMGTFALQRMVSVLIPETNLVVYGHWWAIITALMAWWRSENYKPRAIVALAFVTGSSGIYALMGESGYPLLFLIEHLLVLIVGAVFRRAWAMWWGVIAVVLAVLYFLRDYTFLAPLFLGILLIIFVVWRLSKMGNK